MQRAELLARLVEADSSRAENWVLLGHALLDCATEPEASPVVKVRDDDVTARRCFVEALSLNAFDPKAWVGLGRTVGPKETLSLFRAEYSKKDCFLTALGAGVEYGDAWLQLSRLVTEERAHDESGGTLQFGDQRYTAEDCLELYRYFTETAAAKE